MAYPGSAYGYANKARASIPFPKQLPLFVKPFFPQKDALKTEYTVSITQSRMKYKRIFTFSGANFG